MKKSIFIAAAMVALMLNLPAAENSQQKEPAIPAGMTGGYETVQGKVLKVYSAKDNGAQFRAYAVKWKDQEIIVSDTLCTSNKKEGDTITFMAQRMEMPHGEQKLKLLHFMIMEFPGLSGHDIEKLPGAESTKPAPKE
ncbi:MAG TPA: hypothetical protein DET40_15500 [Lentisphaeria bacterium]|nr:MAG: hypothetical protein A2X45_04850 [Lentisphaerae bacterium GWF2_50_93]HCE44944.1 hypothetical protein [Lentisphaeria bacterium]